ncbi:uncharacterized protein NEMAJ01_0934 [Nematocida major]|uniref:uncharacterized protein n=1 Tax=Nematocida major TaxID=1912982 RepID=UPI0020086C5F|nr:uncharacterized protein NEMAJ01_0934 [Nematocida major]KAH9386038.1 hypothetical protein NEMAJ01_0934 [Nematocida major]
MAQSTRQLPIKEHDIFLENLEKENFDLKLQISHLKSRLNDLTNSSHTFIPACDCKRTQSETKDVLSEVKVEMESLIENNGQLKSQNADLLDRLEEMNEQNESLQRDCVKLSHHISEQTRKETESKRILQEMQAEIESVRMDLEELDSVKKKNKRLEEEYLALDILTKKLEIEYKEENSHLATLNSNLQKKDMLLHDRILEISNQVAGHARENQQLQSQNQALSQEKNALALEAQNLMALNKSLQAQLQMKTTEAIQAKNMGERLVTEIKNKSKITQTQKDDLERRAEEIIKERDFKIAQLKQDIVDIGGEMEVLGRTVSGTHAGLLEYVNYVSSLSKRMSTMSGEIEKSRRLFDSFVQAYKTGTAKQGAAENRMASIHEEKCMLEKAVQETRIEIERSKQEKKRLALEKEELLARLQITPSCLKIAKELGIHEFKSINDLFVCWKDSHTKLLREIEGRHAKEEHERNLKLEEFQTKLQAALAELHFCRAYLEKKKQIIKMMKKHGDNPSILNKIDVSNK